MSTVYQWLGIKLWMYLSFPMQNSSLKFWQFVEEMFGLCAGMFFNWFLSTNTNWMFKEMQEECPVPKAWLELLGLAETLKADGEAGSQESVESGCRRLHDRNFHSHILHSQFMGLPLNVTSLPTKPRQNRHLVPSGSLLCQCAVQQGWLLLC